MQTFAQIFKCPWCGKGEVLVYGQGPVIISVQCPKDRRIFTVDLDTGKIERGQPCKRLGRGK